MAAVAALRPGLVVAPAFLDLAEPDLTAVTNELRVDRAVVVPLLFAEAFHARVDVPQAVAAAAAGSNAELLTAEILGLGPAVLAALRGQAASAGVGAKQDILLLAVGTSDPAANAAVAELAERWSAQRAGDVRAVFATIEPRVSAVLDEQWAELPAVVSLFLAPGLLLDQVGRLAAERGVLVTPPLGTALALLVLERYDAALAV